LEDWAIIRRLAAEGIPNARIAERLGISRTTVIKAVRSSNPPNYERTAKATSFVTFEPRVRALLEEFPDMPSSVLAERVEWTGCGARAGTSSPSSGTASTSSTVESTRKLLGVRLIKCRKCTRSVTSSTYVDSSR